MATRSLLVKWLPMLGEKSMTVADGCEVLAEGFIEKTCKDREVYWYVATFCLLLICFVVLLELANVIVAKPSLLKRTKPEAKDKSFSAASSGGVEMKTTELRGPRTST